MLYVSMCQGHGSVSQLISFAGRRADKVMVVERIFYSFKLEKYPVAISMQNVQQILCTE